MHSQGEYRAHGEIIYDGKFCNGAMHGEGRLLLENGDIWAGQFWKVTFPARWETQNVKWDTSH